MTTSSEIFEPHRLSPLTCRTQKKILHEGKKKILFAGPDAETYILHFKDDPHLAFGENCTVLGSGAFCNRLSALLMARLSEAGLATHYLKTANMREQFVRRADPLPFRLNVHSVLPEDLAHALSRPEGERLTEPLIECVLPQGHVLSAHHLPILGLADAEEIDHIFAFLQRVHGFLVGFLRAFDLIFLRGLFYLGHVEHDPDHEPHLVLMNELSLHNLWLFDQRTSKSLAPPLSSEDLRTLAKRLGFS